MIFCDDGTNIIPLMLVLFLKLKVDTHARYILSQNFPKAGKFLM